MSLKAKHSQLLLELYALDINWRRLGRGREELTMRKLLSVAYFNTPKQWCDREER